MEPAFVLIVIKFSISTVQFSDIQYIHVVMQPSPAIYLQNYFIIPNSVTH